MAPHSWIFSAFSVDSSSCFCLFTPGRVPIPVHTVLKYGTEFIQYAMLHFWDQRGTASLRYRNRTEITVLMCKQKPYPVRFSFPCKSYNLGQNCWENCILGGGGGAFFLNFVADRFFPSPRPLEAVLLGLQRKAGSLSICRMQLWTERGGFLYAKPLIWK